MNSKIKLEQNAGAGLEEVVNETDLEEADGQVGDDGSRYTRILQLVDGDWEEFWIRLDDSQGLSEGGSHELTH